MTESEKEPSDPTGMRELREQAHVTGQPWLFLGTISTPILLGMLNILPTDASELVPRVFQGLIAAVAVAMIVVLIAVPVSKVPLRRRSLKLLYVLMVGIGVLGAVVVLVA